MWAARPGIRLRGRPGQLTSEREPSNLQFSTVRKIPCAPLMPCTRAASPASHQHVCRARCSLCARTTRTPPPRMRTPGVSFRSKSHPGDQTDPFSSITKAVDATLSKDPVQFNKRFEQLLFTKPGVQRNPAWLPPRQADSPAGEAPFTEIHAHAVQAMHKTPEAGAETPGQGRGGHVRTLRVALAIVHSANGSTPRAPHTL